MERALQQGAHDPRANGMLCWMLQHRGQRMIDWREVQRGHWLWNRIHHEITGRWPEEEEEEEDESDDLP